MLLCHSHHCVLSCCHWSEITTHWFYFLRSGIMWDFPLKASKDTKTWDLTGLCHTNHRIIVWINVYRRYYITERVSSHIVSVHVLVWVKFKALCFHAQQPHFSSDGHRMSTVKLAAAYCISTCRRAVISTSSWKRCLGRPSVFFSSLFQ